MIDELAVFVYGTLKPGGHYWADFCEGKVTSVSAAKVKGELYDLGVGYPGLLLQGSKWVEGCVLQFACTQDFAEVDRLEGYSPDRPHQLNEYMREKVEVFELKGTRIGAVWTYTMTEETIRKFEGKLIPDGNWLI